MSLGRAFSAWESPVLSGLLGGVLKGNTLSGGGLRPPWPKFGTLASIFGLSARLTGGGRDALFGIPIGDVPLVDGCPGLTLGERINRAPGLVERPREGGLCRDTDEGERSEIS
jgi:hypothetical protein